MARPAPRQLQVIRTEQLTLNMLRVTLGGDGLGSFPPDQESAYIKLLFIEEGSDRPIVRTYTVRHQRDDEIDVDFVLHGDMGPAANWAKKTKPGETILVRGPGPKKLVNPDAEWFLIVGDMTALPAISVNIEQLPANAKGYAVIEVIDSADIQQLSAPENFNVQWLINPNPGEKNQLLIDHVKKLSWPSGNKSVWSACEFGSMRLLKDYFRNDRQLDNSDLYISSYWKYGGDEEAHRAAKRAEN